MVDSPDKATATAFATSWNNLPEGSIYTLDQFEDWFFPLTKTDIDGTAVLELGCGNGSLMVHMLGWKPERLVGVDLGDSIRSARKNLRTLAVSNWEIKQADLVHFRADESFDFVYCIGVLHHLTDPDAGFQSVLENVKPGGRFHCWVYAKEGNGFVIAFVDPIRKIVSKLPWFITKYLVATPLAMAFYLYAKTIALFKSSQLLSKLPMYAYCRWISKRGFLFFRHVVFDQLVTPQTLYIKKAQVESWLKHPLIVPDSTYVLMRNGNSWKFGGKRR